MPLNTVVQSLQVTLTEYNVKIHEQSKVRVTFCDWLETLVGLEFAQRDLIGSSAFWSTES